MEALLRSATDPSDLANVSHPNLPYKFDRIFNLEGFGAKRLAKKRLKLIQAIDEKVQVFLNDGESVEFVSWGVEYSLVEHYFMGLWAYLLNRRAIVLTNRRVLLMQINSSRKPMQLKFQIRYQAIQKFAKATLGYLGIVTRDKKTHYITGIPRKDRKQIRALIERQVQAVRSDAPASGRDNLCPHCGHRVVGLPDRCSQCAKEFKSGARAGWLSLLWPGLGDLYLGHRVLGVFEALGALAAWAVLVVPFAIGVDGAAPDHTMLAIMTVFVFVFVHGMDSFVTRRVGLKGIYPAHA